MEEDMSGTQFRGTTSILMIGAWLAAATATAQEYPSRPIRLVVPNAASGGHDASARVVAHKLSETLGRQVVVDNRGGAGGMIGSEIVARAAADGYTLLSGTIATHVIVPNVFARSPYDPLKDFAPISLYAMVQSVLVAHPGFRPKTVQELIALARSKPGAVDIASAGIGSTTHLALALFLKSARIDLNHVPYKSAGAAFAATAAGEVPVYFGLIPAAIPLAKAGRIRIMAVGGAKRSDLLPEVPTVAESGVPGYSSGGWYGLMAPARTPSTVIKRLHEATVAAVSSTDTKQALRAMGGDAVTNTPREFEAFIRSELGHYTDIIKAANMKPE
jgi:tripartite-type tricarboxylate transporter receptor subunit TctC